MVTFALVLAPDLAITHLTACNIDVVRGTPDRHFFEIKSAS